MARLEQRSLQDHIPYMDEFSCIDRKEEKLEQLLWEGNSDDKMYLYWILDGKRIKPAILKNLVPFDDLRQFLQAEYGPQSYFLMIRRKKKMIFTGKIGIAAPFNFMPRKDIRLEIEHLRRAKRKQ